MKIKLALALLLISITTFAQDTSTAEVETALSRFLAEYNKSPYDFFKKRSTDDFRYIDRQGAFVLKPALLKSSEGRPGLQSSASDLKIFRLGDLAVVSGIQSYDGNENVKTAFTYTLKKEGKGPTAEWKFAASQHTPILAQPTSTRLPDGLKADEAAIRAVLEGHTQASMDRDAEKTVSYLANSPNVAVSYNVPGYPRGYDVIADGYRKILGSMPKTPQKLSTGDYRYRIVGNTAFVTSIETYTKPDGTVSKMHKANYLEKEGSQWKIIGNFWMPEVPAK